MLSSKQQTFLILLLEKNLTKKNNGLYESRAFYRTITYLKRNNLIRSSRLDNNMNQYSLTIKGSVLARLLAGLEGVDDRLKEKYAIV